MKITHTYAVLDISPSAFAEIKAKLEHAGYTHLFGMSEGRETIDLQGIAVAPEKE